MNPFAALTESIVQGRRKDAARLTQEAIAAGHPPKAILEEGLIPGMAIVGDRFKKNEIFVPEMLIAARAMKEALVSLEPLLIAAGIRPEFTALIGAVQGDLHDIGKNLVAMMWKGANFNVIDLGTNVPPDKFVAAVEEHKPHVVGLSALLTTTMPAMKDAVAALRAKFGSGIKIMVGGAPITEDYAREIGADGYSADAASAVEVAHGLLRAH